MEAKASFSRLQLAAALIEYDNDDPDPTKPRRSAHESAIFAHLRAANPRRPTPSRRSTDFLGVALPSEAGSVYGRESVVGDRRSKAGSVDALQNPFGRDSTWEGPLEEDEAEDMEVDLASWGLDTLIPKEKEKAKERRKSKPDPLPNPHTRAPSPGSRMGPTANRPTHGARAMSMGNFDSFGEGGAFLESMSSADLSGRRHSFGSPLDLPAAKTPDFLHQRRRTNSEHVLIENLPVTPPLHSIPFPTSGGSDRSVSPLPLADGQPGGRPSSRASLLDTRHGRTYSSASLGSKALLNEEPNPFAVRPPSPDRASRFDPKARARTMSNATMGTQAVLGSAGEKPNPFAVRPPSPSRASVFDPKARARTVSQGTLGTQMMLGDDEMPEDSEDRPPMRRLYSRLELMRPKVLIMPSPLQGTMPTSSSTPSSLARDGFEVTDGPPLPPGARTNRKSSATFSVMDPTYAPVASNSFIPNPRQSLTLSQLTFRNTLLVDGQTDVAYNDINDHMRRATQDGDQIGALEAEVQPEPTTPVAPVSDPLDRSKRPAGKLYGKSLIEDLEARKAEMHSKRRVFTGDQRPSMMARTPMQRSSTLISPEALVRPISQRMDSFKSTPDMSRPNSSFKPLVNLQEGIPGAPPRAFLGLEQAGAGNKRSVFGVDTLWERELAKLKEIEERERQETEVMRLREAELEDRGGKKKKKKGKKGKGVDLPSEPASMVDLQAESLLQQLPRAESPPFVLPDVPKVAARRGPPPPSADDEDEEDSDSDEAPARTRGGDVAANDWAADSDEEKGPIRAPGVGPRYPNGPPRLVLSQDIAQDDESSEEDVPLVATIGRAAQRVTRLGVSQAGDDSDEDKPLSVVLDKTLDKTRITLPSFGSGSLFPDANDKGGDDEDDDKPLGLKLPAGSPNPLAEEVDDEQPLGLHPEQMRRTTQYMMVQQQMAQQQQMMMQAQLHQSMIFGNPSMMSSGFFAPPIPPPVMIPPQLPATPPPVPDSVKFVRVDRWRHDVAVEGDQ